MLFYYQKDKKVSIVCQLIKYCSGSGSASRIRSDFQGQVHDAMFLCVLLIINVFCVLLFIVVTEASNSSTYLGMIALSLSIMLYFQKWPLCQQSVWVKFYHFSPHYLLGMKIWAKSWLTKCRAVPSVLYICINKSLLSGIQSAEPLLS